MLNLKSKQVVARIPVLGKPAGVAMAPDGKTAGRLWLRDVLVKGFVDEVVIFCGAIEIARHPRVYGRCEFVFDPKHYLALLEQKPGALDRAVPLQGWRLPESVQHLRRLLEARVGLNLRSQTVRSDN
jgi:hypothetical protein